MAGHRCTALRTIRKQVLADSWKLLRAIMCMAMTKRTVQLQQCMSSARAISQQHPLLCCAVWFMPLQYGKGFTLVDPDIARTVLCIFWLLAEPVRLAAGWYGNLQENVSAQFWSKWSTWSMWSMWQSSALWHNSTHAAVNVAAAVRHATQERDGRKDTTLR